MAKLTLLDIVSGYAVVSTYNTNNTAIEAALENTLSRDGTAPNAMGANLDMDSHLIRNLSDGTLSADAVNLRQLQATTGTAAAFPSQTGNANKVLKTDGTVVGWEKPQDIANSNTPAGNIVATTIQTAINELDTEKAADSSVVHLAGTETITGAKTVSATLSMQALIDLSHASAGQVKFPAVQNASDDANTLDDYEEGTWTPSLGGTATYVSRSGTYVKIGKLVFFSCHVAVDTLGTGSASAISGLPFVVMLSLYSGSSVHNFTGIAAAVASLHAVFVSPDGIGLSGTSAGGGTSSETVTTIFTNGTDLQVSGCYITS